MLYVSEYLANKLLDHVFKNTAYTAPATVYVGLYKALPLFNTATPGSEVSGGSYARKAITFGTGADDGMILSTAKVTFPTPTADWATAAAPCVCAIVLDALTDGNWLIASDLCPLIVLNGASAPEIEVGGYQAFIGPAGH